MREVGVHGHAGDEGAAEPNRRAVSSSWILFSELDDVLRAFH